MDAVRSSFPGHHEVGVTVREAGRLQVAGVAEREDGIDVMLLSVWTVAGSFPTMCTAKGASRWWLVKSVCDGDDRRRRERNKGDSNDDYQTDRCLGDSD